MYSFSAPSMFSKTKGPDASIPQPGFPCLSPTAFAKLSYLSMSGEGWGGEQDDKASSWKIFHLFKFTFSAKQLNQLPEAGEEAHLTGVQTAVLKGSL